MKVKFYKSNKSFEDTLDEVFTPLSSHRRKIFPEFIIFVLNDRTCFFFNDFMSFSNITKKLIPNLRKLKFHEIDRCEIICGYFNWRFRIPKEFYFLFKLSENNNYSEIEIK